MRLSIAAKFNIVFLAVFTIGCAAARLVTKHLPRQNASKAVKRAGRRSGERQAFLRLVADHIGKPGEHSRFLADALAATPPGPGCRP